MCGRCHCTLRPDEVPRACQLRNPSVHFIDVDRYRPSFNISPGDYLPVVRRERGGAAEDYEVAVHCMKWGLIPSFTRKTAKPNHEKMFNARSESVTQKVAFKRLVPHNRCLVAVNGFYEWKKRPKKQPYYIHFEDGRPLVFAALYDSWENAEGEILYTFTILTTDASPYLDWLHDRMPVILGDEVSTDIWLNSSSEATFKTVLKPYDKPDLAWYPVTPAMSNPSFDGAACIKQIQLEPEEKPIPVKKVAWSRELRASSIGGSTKSIASKTESGEEVNSSSVKKAGSDVKAGAKRIPVDSKPSIDTFSDLPPVSPKKIKTEQGLQKQPSLT